MRAHLSKGSALLLVFAWPVLCLAQGTFTINFDGPPLQPPGSQFLVQQYVEQGMYFRPIPGTDGIVRAWTDMPPEWPNNGTPYLQAGMGTSLRFSYLDGPVFGLVSVDLAKATKGFSSYAMNFVGYRSDGSSITTSFSGTNIIFQTRYFEPEWSFGLTRVEIPNHPWSLDNLVIHIPEPSTTALLVVVAPMVILWRIKRRKSS